MIAEPNHTGGPNRLGWTAGLILLAVAIALSYSAQWYSHWDLVTLVHSDLFIFRGGGELVLTGQPLYEYQFWAGYWTYPPFGALVMTPLAILPEGWVYPIWTLTSLTALVVVVVISFKALISRTDHRVSRVGLVVTITATAVALTPVANALGMGQLGIMLTAACLIDVVVLGRRASKWQGVLIGITAAIKLTPALFIVYFLARRQWRAALTSSLTVTVCWALSALLHWQDTRYYFENLVLFNTTGQIGSDALRTANQSLYGTIHRTLDGGVATVAFIAAAGLAVCLGVAAAKRLGDRGETLAAASIVGLTSVLVSPISWHHHAIWVLPALGVIVGHGYSRRRNLLAGSLAAGLAIPMTFSQPITGTTEWFVVMYLVTAVAVVAVTRHKGPIDRQTQTLNEAPDAYFRDAYDPVMYTGAIGVYSRIVHSLMERRNSNDRDGVVLELGAGKGQHARYLRGSYRVYYETDISITDDGPVDPTTDKGHRRVFADAENLDRFPDGSVDRVIATCLLAHLAAPEGALREWRRVVRPGGTVTIYIPAEPGMLLRFLRRFFVVPKARKFGQNHLAIIYRDHRNHYPAMCTQVESVFKRDRVSKLGFPTRLLGWNLRLFDVYYITRSPVDGPTRPRELMIGSQAR